MFGVETVFMVISWGCISDNLLEMRGNKYCMSSECSEDDLPLVTIITPTYNSIPQYLKEAIESVLEQTYPKIEYIITDDGSSVFHEELIHELLRVGNRGNITWKIIRHDENVGTVKNMNGAIRESHGEYIFGLAHDDVYYDERVIEEWVAEFQKTGALVMTGLRECWDMEVNAPTETLPTIEEREYLVERTPRELNKILHRYNFISGASTAQSKECIDKYKLFDEQYRLLEDYPAYLKLTYNDVRIIFWPRKVIKYRKVGITSNTKKIHGNLQLDNDGRILLKQKMKEGERGDKLILSLLYILASIRIKATSLLFRTNAYDLKKARVFWGPEWALKKILRLVGIVVER